MMIPNRVFFLLLGLGCLGLLGYGYYLQYFQELEPCPMCIFQRLCYMAITAIALIGAAHGRGPRVYSILAGIAASIGAGIAARQTWLQHLPPELVPECGPGLEFMLEVYPLLETLERALKGTGDCAEVSWRFLGFSIAEWSLVCFCAIIVSLVWHCVWNLRQKKYSPPE